MSEPGRCSKDSKEKSKEQKIKCSKRMLRWVANEDKTGFYTGESLLKSLLDREESINQLVIYNFQRVAQRQWIEREYNN